MGYQLEIAAVSKRGLRSVPVGNPTRHHYEPILDVLGLNACNAGDDNGNWASVDAAVFSNLDVLALEVVHGIPGDLLSELVELRDDVAQSGPATIFARLSA